MEFKKAIKIATSLALVLAGLATPSVCLAQTEIDASRIETYHRIERLTRNNKPDSAQIYINKVSTEEEINFVDLLESGTIFVLDTAPSTENNNYQLTLSGINQSLSESEYSNLQKLPELPDGETKVIYANSDSFKSANYPIPDGYKKCINLDYIETLDESQVGDYDYVHISPKYNANSLETKEFYTKEQYEQILESMKQITSNIKDDDNDFVKMAKIYLNTINYMTYDHEERFKEHDRDASCGNLLSVIKGTGVCAGYTDIVLNAALSKGVECLPVIDQTDTSGHAWNVFYYTDKHGNTSCYGIDTTFGDGTSKEIRNNFATNTFESSHSDHYDVEIPLAYCENATRSNAGFGNRFIEEFLQLVENDINIRPETYQEMKKNGITCEMLISAKQNNPELFEGPVENNEEMIFNKSLEYQKKEEKPSNDLAVSCTKITPENDLAVNPLTPNWEAIMAVDSADSANQKQNLEDDFER